jgi:predicted phage terminase large subunit-like protein
LTPTVTRELLIEAAERRAQLKQKEVKIQAAREHLLPYIEYTKPSYRAGWFHREVCTVFEDFLADVLAGKRPRVILCGPPQHGKTEVASRRFPTWALGKHPNLRFICASYAATWAEAISGDRQRIMGQCEYQDTFPELELTKKRSEEVQTSASGFMLAAGVDCGITGRSADIGIIDDPIKGYKEATSQLTKDSIWNWYRTDFYTRLQSGAGVIIMMTRWAEDDLVGRLMDEAKNGGEEWQVYNFPAIAEQDEPNRKKGEPLSPERFDLSDLESMKRVQGSYAWSALYQGHPAPAEGLMLKRDYWRYYQREDLPKFQLVVVSLDAAFKETTDSDHVALHVWGFVASRGYCLDRQCERMGYTATKAAAYKMAVKWKAHVLLIEDKANGSAVIEELGRSPISTKTSVIAVQPAGGKLARAWPFSADLEAGNAYLPQYEAWAQEIVEYAAKFPTSPMDHDIDAITQCFNWRRENMHGLFDFYESESAAILEKQKNGTLMAPLTKIEVNEKTPSCPSCVSHAVRRTQTGPDGEKYFQCNQCGHGWLETDKPVQPQNSLWSRSASLERFLM